MATHSKGVELLNESPIGILSCQISAMDVHKPRHIGANPNEPMISVSTPVKEMLIDYTDPSPPIASQIHDDRRVLGIS